MGWTSVSLAEVCSVRSSLVDPTDPIFRDLPHVAPDSIERNSGQLLTFRTAAQDGVTSGKYKFEAGDLLYSKIRPNLNKAVLVGFHGLCSADMYALNINKLRVDPAFLGYIIRGNGFLSYATSYSNRANIPKLNRIQLEGFKFELPPIGEQRRIAAILDHADGLRAKRREAVAHLDALTQSIFLQMFGDVTKNDRGWPRGLVSDIVSGFQSGKSLVAEDKDDLAARYRVLKVSAVTSLRFRPEESKALPADYTPPESHFVKDGDLLFSRANTTDLIGATALVRLPPSNLLLSDKLWRFQWKSDRSSPEYVWRLFQQPQFRVEIGRRATGTSGSMQNISQQNVLSVPIALPPAELQREFATQARTIESLRRSGLENLSMLDTLFASLQSRAFSGQL